MTAGRQNLLLLGVSFALALLLAEVGLRAAGISYPQVYVMDPVRGSALRPGAEGWYRSEGHAYFKINSDGLRDREHSLAKRANAIRIAVLGDSVVEAMQVEEDRNVSRVLDRKLSECEALGGKQVEVINFGSSGYSTAHELLTLRHQVWKYKPDIVLLTFFTGNDVRDNSGKLNVEPLSPFFYYEGDRLVLDTSFRRAYRSGRVADTMRELRDGVVARSRVAQLFYEARRHWRARGKDGLAARGDGTEPGVDNHVFSPPKSPDWEEAWRITEGLLTTMSLEVRAKDARFLLVTVSSGIQLHPDLDVRQAFQKRFGIDDLFYPDSRLKRFAERQGITVLTLAPSLAAYAQEHRVFLHGFSNSRLGTGHWNEEGHRVAGEIIARWMCGLENSGRREETVHRDAPKP